MTLTDAALAYARAGFSIVPVSPGAKRPPLVSWQQYQHERATPEQVAQWWAEWPEANIAIITGQVSGVNVLDLDPRSGAVLDDWRFATPCVLTPSGGRHLYFRADLAWGSPVGVLPGVDLRCDGAYVIAPPSLFGPARDTLPPIPWNIPAAELSALLSRELLPWSDVVPRFAERKAETTQHEPWVARALAEGAVIGEQRYTLTRLAGYFARRLPEDVCAGLLWGAVQRWSQNDSDPWQEGQVTDLVRWVYAKAAETPDPVYRFRSTVASPDAAPQEERIARVRGRVRTAASRATEPSAQIDWIVENLLARGAVTELIAPPKLGKTTLMLSVVKSVLAGTAAFGAWPAQAVNVFLLSEQSPSSLTGSLARCGLESSPSLWILTASDLYQLSWPEVVAVAVESAVENKCGLLVIDTLAWLAGVEDENRAEEAKAALQPLGAAVAAGLSVLLVRHSRKGAERIYEAGRGSSAWSGAVDIMASLQQIGKTDLRELQTVGRLGENQTLALSYSSGDYAKSDETRSTQARKTRTEQRIDRVEQWLTSEWSTIREVAQRADITWESARKALRRFHQETDPHGEVLQIDESVSPHRYRLAPTYNIQEAAAGAD